MAEQERHGYSRCLPGWAGEQHAMVKEMEVLLLPATEGFVKISDLNLMDKQLQ